MRIDIWTDIVCPFCFLGKQRLNQALEQFEHAEDVEIVWRSFELDPNMPSEPTGSVAEAIAVKYGLSLEQSEQSQRQIAQQLATVGLRFDWQHAQFSNTFDAHRVMHMAADRGLGDQAQDALMRAFFEQARIISDRDTLLDVAEGIGLERSEVAAMLASDAYTERVREDEAQAHGIGVQGVPFFVFNRKFAVSGAQPAAVFTQALEQAWADSQNLLADEGGCGGGACCS